MMTRNMRRVLVMAAFSAASHNLENELYAIIDCLDELIPDSILRDKCLLSLKLLNESSKNNFLNQDDLETLVSLLTDYNNNFIRVETV